MKTASKLLILLILTAMLSSCEQLQKIYNSLKTGAPCEDETTCLEGACMTQAEGFTGGMCTRLGCEETGCWSFFTECFPASVRGENTSMCLPTCNNGRTCERANEGYECRILDEAFVCVPSSGVVKTEVPGVTGATCNVDSECNGTDGAAKPTCLTDFKNGYCSQVGCSTNAECLNNEPCVSTNPKDGSAPKICLKGCRSQEDCRFGYACTDYDGQNVCLPAKKKKVKYENGADDGESCKANMNCKGGVCIRENGGQKRDEGQTIGAVPYAGGYCTTRDCTSNLDCNGSTDGTSICVARGRSTACFKTCNEKSDCRDGYDCVETPGGKVCDSSVELPDVTTDDSGALTIKCTRKDSLDFEVPAGAIGFYISPFTKNGGRVTPKVLNMPGGKTLNIETQYSFMAVNPLLLGTITPILFPATDSPSLKNAFTGGTYSLDVSAQADEVCYYVIPKTTQGSHLQVRIHLVGVRGVTASTAESNRNIQAMMSTFKSIYKKMGVDVSVHSYVDAEQRISERYQIIRNFRDIFSLVATTKNIGDSLAENLVVNVFLIQDFAISEAPGLLGVSTGIPGVAGLNGNIGSGLVFSSSALGTDNTQLGQTMAHEIGHFIALRHTTEHEGSAHDPISDTPECSTPKLQYACRDARNFMFAFSMGADQNQATAGQGFVVRHSPLVR